MIRRSFLRSFAVGAGVPLFFQKALGFEKKKLSKPLLLFASPGSHAITAEEALKPYLKNKYDVETLGDYFHVASRFSVEGEDKSLQTLAAEQGIPQNAFRTSFKETLSGIERFREFFRDIKLNRKKIRKLRLALLKKHEDKNYFLRVNPATLSEEAFEYLNERYTFVCLHRKDQKQQALANVLRAEVGRFSQISKAPLDPTAPVELNSQDFKEALREVKAFHKFFARIKDKVVVDADQLDGIESAHDVLHKIGFVDGPFYVRDADTFARDSFFAKPIRNYFS